MEEQTPQFRGRSAPSNKNLEQLEKSKAKEAEKKHEDGKLWGRRQLSETSKATKQAEEDAKRIESAIIKTSAENRKKLTSDLLSSSLSQMDGLITSLGTQQDKTADTLKTGLVANVKGMTTAVKRMENLYKDSDTSYKKTANKLLDNFTTKLDEKDRKRDELDKELYSFDNTETEEFNTSLAKLNSTLPTITQTLVSTASVLDKGFGKLLNVENEFGMAARFGKS